MASRKPPAAVGYPLLVKAVGGGGGIGMRRVEGPAKLEEVVVATQSMAQKSFSNGAIFLERFVPEARHVEIQVFGFGDGNAVHLFERDCSLQRRFQKVIEEARAPGLPEEVSRAMAEARSPAVPRDALQRRRHGGVHRRRGELRVLLPGDEHAHPGRASGHRDDHRPRSRRHADRSRARRAHRVPARRDRGARPCHRMPHLCRGSGQDVHAFAGPAHRFPPADRDGGCAHRQRLSRGRCGDAVLRSDDRQGRGLWRDA